MFISGVSSFILKRSPQQVVPHLIWQIILPDVLPEAAPKVFVSLPRIKPGTFNCWANVLTTTQPLCLFLLINCACYDHLQRLA